MRTYGNVVADTVYKVDSKAGFVISYLHEY